MHKALTIPIQEDLSEFTQFLWQNEIPHRVVQVDAVNELWVADNVNPSHIETLYDMWRKGEDLSQIRVQRSEPANSPMTIAKRAWLSVSLIIISALVTLLIQFGKSFEYMQWLTVTELVLRNNSVYSADLLHNFDSLQLWRFISPIFMHFSEVHIIFNSLWIWILGTRLEIVQGRLTLLLLVLLTGVASNIAQFYVSGPLFGGLSGVVYALLGYSWLWDRLNPQKAFGLPPAMIGFMVFWLALGYTGLLESLGFGSIANTAHLVGLLVGLAFYPLGRLIAANR